jgi:dipeptide/tripeptide permease
MLVIVGLIAAIIGAIDPLEGSLVILPGAVLVVLGALAAKSRHRRFLAWSLALLAIGIGAMFGMSAVGGLGGSTGHSYWWGLVLLPYPAGWIMVLVGAIRCLREVPGGGAPPAAG